MTEDEFITLEPVAQCHVLTALAAAGLPALHSHVRAFDVAKDAVAQLLRHREAPLPGDQVALYLNNTDDLDRDLSAIYDFVNDDATAIAAIDIIVYATGLNAAEAYRADLQTTGIPEPVLAATSEIVVAALAAYRQLERVGRVAPMNDALN